MIKGLVPLRKCHSIFFAPHDIYQFYKSTHRHYFLAQSGANTQDINESLKTIDTRVTFQSTECIKNTDIEVSYLFASEEI